MKLLFPTLLIFATVIFLSSALPEGKRKGHSRELVEQEYGKPLQRRKPPIKIPGPKLSGNENNPEKEHKMKILSQTDKDEESRKKRIVKDVNHMAGRKEQIQK